jgi:hypothetical protein
MISYLASHIGPVKHIAEGFEPFEYTNALQLSQVILRHTWSPIIFKDNYRNSKNFLFADLCVLDVDNNDPENICPIEKAIEELNGLKYILGTTKSHQLPKNSHPPADRYRILIPFERRITDAREYVASLKWVTNLLDFTDKSCTDAARPFFPCRGIYHAQGEGDGLPVIMPKIEDSPHQKTMEGFKRSAARLPRHILEFLEHGKYFGDGRNDSCFVTANYLLDKGITFDEIVNMIESSPFDRTAWKQNEVYSVVSSAWKKRHEKTR